MLIKDLYHVAKCTLTPELTIQEALVILNGSSNGAVVLDKGNIVGVVTIQDIAGAVVPPEYMDDSRLAAALYVEWFVEEQIRTIASRPISKVMRRDMCVVDVEDNLLAIMTDFLQNDLYLLPVLDKWVFVWVVSRRDVKELFMKVLGINGQ